jgi:hypothetical protein
MMPGSLMYRVELSCGLAVAEVNVARQVRCLASSPAFTGIPAAERDALLESIAQTIGRADYHFRRFRLQRESLDDLRAWAPGDVFFDAAVATMHYELQALAGAARLLVDEVVFLIAKRYGQQGWAAARIFRDPVAVASPADQPEVHRLRNHTAWFDLLNTYRNAFFHSGWKHGSGHFEPERKAAGLPAMNALLVPDRVSLAGRSRPYEWTYNDGTTVDDVCNGVYEGLLTMLGDLCAHEWGTPLPTPGTIAEDDRPNLIVALPIPIVVSIGDSLVAPIFSSRERAFDFTREIPGLSTAAHTSLELVEVRSSPDVAPPTEMLAFSFVHLTSAHGAKFLKLSLDPVLRNGVWSEGISASVDLDELLKDKMRMAGVVVPAPTTAYVWRTPFLIS